MLNMPHATFFLTISMLLTHFSSYLDAGGTYHIGRDEGGVYMETDQDGSWYIDQTQVSDFSLGETGIYAIKTDHDGTFIITPKGAKYYIDSASQQKWEQELQAFNEKQRQGEDSETRVTILDGTHVIVPVTIRNEDSEMEVLMLLDTGASSIVLHREIADQLMLGSPRKTKLMMADGRMIEGDIVDIDYVNVGPIKKQGLSACIIEHESRTGYQGLLGMNFLKGVDYRIDFDRQVIHWRP